MTSAKKRMKRWLTLPKLELHSLWYNREIVPYNLINIAKIRHLPNTLFEIFIFCPKIQLWFSRENCRFFWVKNSWKCGSFGLFSCWQLWFHDKNCQKKFGLKTCENAGVLSKLNFWTKNEDFEQCVDIRVKKLRALRRIEKQNTFSVVVSIAMCCTVGKSICVQT